MLFSMNSITAISFSRLLASSLLALAPVFSGRAIAEDASRLPAGATAAAANRSMIRAGEKAHDIHVAANVNAPIEEVWRVFTTSAGAEEFFAPKANIQLTIGGAYEIFFDPADPTKSTQGMRLLSYSPGEMVSFQWSGPPSLPEVRNGGMWVVVELRRVSATVTRVELSHLGWKSGSGWDAAYPHMLRGWNDLMERLKLRFQNGPVNWANEVQATDVQAKDGFTLKEHKRS
jgi:uncharacterized protein YndB with AHSA1/START domain